MRSTILLGAAAMIGLIATDPAFCMQAAPPSAEQMPPADTVNPNPVPMPDPAQPAPPLTESLPPEMPVPAGEAQTPVQGSTDAPVGSMATPPTAAAPSAQSGGTTSSMMQPVAATKEYPPCSKTLQDNCRNPGEGPKATRKRR
jgi:hypothetical protein